MFSEYAEQKEEVKGAKEKKKIEINKDDVKKVGMRLLKDDCYIGKVPDVNEEEMEKIIEDWNI